MAGKLARAQGEEHHREEPVHALRDPAHPFGKQDETHQEEKQPEADAAFAGGVSCGCGGSDSKRSRFPGFSAGRQTRRAA